MKKTPDYQRLYDRTQGRLDIVLEVAESTVQTMENALQAMQKSSDELRRLVERIKQVHKNDVEKYEIEEYDHFKGSKE